MSSTPNEHAVSMRYRAAIIGAGPAGLAAATGLLRAGINDFILIERAPGTGGILNQCIHNGFGLKYYSEDLTGPEFARRMEAELRRDEARQSGKGPVILCSSMVSELRQAAPVEGEAPGFRLRVHSREKGLLSIEADCVITATGCRERTRENIEVPGTRPAGLFTAGQAQNLINLGHHRVGRRAVIQGSGDIGLIMARRLALEGVEVVAVYERLPHLSGSIRNKVQCLDHFGIPLYLSRQVSDIRGRSRVSAVETAALNNRFEPVPGTAEVVKCDTVLFAAGLIPELETVKPAGVRLPDGFHPDINTFFETNVPGLFASGNCLHINDLADTAAEEGLKTAESAVEYLADPSAFRSAVSNAASGLPYTEAEPQTGFNGEFFKQISDEGLTVCIICPRGCLLKKDDYGCSRGEEYFKRLHSSGSGLRQRIHTSVELGDATTNPAIASAVSIEEIPVEIAPEVLSRLKRLAKDEKAGCCRITVKTENGQYGFNLCPQESGG